MYRLQYLPGAKGDKRPWLVQHMDTGIGAWGATPEEAIARYIEIWGEWKNS